MLRWAAMIARYQGEADAARAFAEEAAAGYRATGDIGGLASAIDILGGVALDERKYEEARALFEEGKSMREKLGDEIGLVYPLHHLGLIALERGQHDEARRRMEAGLALARKHGQELEVANSLCDLGFVAIKQSRYEEARELLVNSLRIAWKDNGHFCLVGLASVSAAAEEPERAARLLGASEAVGAEIHHPLDPYAESTRAKTARKLDSRLGPDRFAACFAEGRSLSFSEAVSLALADLD
jgi:tetratricopeptide (TPR) repeat protein